MTEYIPDNEPSVGIQMLLSGEKVCAACLKPVTASAWGFQWQPFWFHYDCIEQLNAAMKRIRGAERLDIRPNADQESKP